MATVMESIALTLEEKIVPAIFESLWDLDDVYSFIKRSSHKVTRDKHIGRGWKVLKTFITGVSGGAKFRQAQGSEVVSGNHFNMYGTPQTWPALDETSSPGFVQAEVSLIEHPFNVFLPHSILRADMSRANIGSVVAHIIKNLGRLLALQEASTFFSSNPATGELADIGDTSVTVSNKTSPAADTQVVVIDLGGTNASGRIHRFNPGSHVDLYDSTGTVKRNVGYRLVVDNVDPLEETLELRRPDGEFQVDTVLGGGVTFDGSGADDDILVIADSVNVLPKGLESWIADGTTVTDFYGIDVRNFGQFKSYVPSAINSALTENILNRHIGWFFEAFPGLGMDCILTTFGVLNGFIDNLDSGLQAGSNASSGRNRYDRNGAPLSVEAGYDSFRYRFAGRPMEILTSTMSAKETLYAGKIKNGGLTRYIPPPLPGSKQDSSLGTEVEWIGPMGKSGGYKDMFLHARLNGDVTNFLEAPGTRMWNVIPSQANWMKLTGITEVLGE